MKLSKAVAAKRVALTTTMALALMGGDRSFAQSPQVGGGLDLTVAVTHLKSAEGQLVISVFDREEGFPGQADRAAATVRISPSQPVTTFRQLPPGNYAVTVVHDRNKNGKLDKSFVGLPSEPVGLSNFQTLGMSNRPTFRKALFPLRQSGTVKIKMIPFGR